MTKKYFGTDGIRGRVGSARINPEFVLKLGWALGKVLGRSGPGKVLIGKDTRVSGYMFESALEPGWAASDFETLLVGGVKYEEEESSEFIVTQLGLTPIVIPEMQRSINFKEMI